MQKKRIAHHIQRSIPYLHSLQKSNLTEAEKVHLLKRFPDFVLKDIIEVLFNIVNKNIKTSPKLTSSIKRNEKVVVNFLDKAKRHKRTPKSLLYNQKGQFLGLVLPAILSVLTSIVSSSLT